jgi:hypothetical protein
MTHLLIDTNVELLHLLLVKKAQHLEAASAHKNE